MGWLVPSFMPVSMSCAVPTPSINAKKASLTMGICRGGACGRVPWLVVSVWCVRVCMYVGESTGRGEAAPVRARAGTCF